MAKVVRDYGVGGVSVVMASNEQGRVEPFVFESRHLAERTAEQIEELGGYIQSVLVWHGVELLGTIGAQRVLFGLRKEKADAGS